MSSIYLDHNATTPLDPRVTATLKEHLDHFQANPSSLHTFGRQQKQAVIAAHRTVADAFSVKPQQVIFTSGGTEGMNHLLKGIVAPEAHIISTAVEHSAVRETLRAFPHVTTLPVGASGGVTLEAVAAAVTERTELICCMMVNNETGVKNPIAEIGLYALEKGIPFIVDAVAAVGKEPFVIPPGVSAICFSGHKLHAPQGVGCVILQKGVKLRPLLVGGEQEGKRRGGTENVLGMVGLAKAIELLAEELPEATVRMAHLRDRFEKSLLGAFPHITVNGHGPRIANTSNLLFDGVDGETLLIQLDQQGIAASHGSACSAGALEPSPVLLAMGLSHQQARSSIRFSLSRFTTEQEIDQTLDILFSLLKK
ncbi:MAG: cysteine desulfurase [Chlamydiia bacterium]|nr:cysteine desulfurase [Chlamydiia bacterium]